MQTFRLDVFSQASKDNRTSADLRADASRPFRARDRKSGRRAADHGENPRRGPRFTFWGAGFALLVLGSAGAWAAAPAALRSVATACEAEAARWCAMSDAVRSEEPETASAAIDGRSAYICLRPYRTSLSLSCRRAIAAVAGH